LFVCAYISSRPPVFFARDSERRRAQQKSSPSKALRSNFSRREPFLSFNTTAATTNTLHGASKRERERENKKETRHFAREEHSSRDAPLALSFVPSHIFPFESSFGGKTSGGQTISLILPCGRTRRRGRAKSRRARRGIIKTPATTKG